MGDDGEIGRLHAELERLAAEVRELRERLDDRDLEQAARDDALNRAMTGGRRPWSPRLLDGAAGAKAALVALTVAKGAAAICEGLKSLPFARRQRLKVGRANGRRSELHGDAPLRVQADLLVQIQRIDRGQVIPQRHVRLEPRLPHQHAARFEDAGDRPSGGGPHAVEQPQRSLRLQPGQLILDGLVPDDAACAACGEAEGVPAERGAEPPGVYPIPDPPLKCFAASRIA